MIKKRVFVDADSCPVKKDIYELTERHRIPVIYVASYRHMTDHYPGEWVYVDPDPDAADFYIVSHAAANDIVITSDMGLSALLTAKAVLVLTPTGIIVNDKDIPLILYNRYIGKKERAEGHRTKGPKPFTEKDRRLFRRVLSDLLV